MTLRTLLLFIFMVLAKNIQAAPNTIWHFDELGTITYPYTLNDTIANKDGEAFNTPSTGNAAGKICSALNFAANSTQDSATLDASTLDGANDFTISVWHKGSSTAGRSLLSGARTGQDNALLMWFPSATRFHGYLNGGNFSNINFPSIADNQWHHLVWRRTANQTCFFTDGVQRGCHNTTNASLQIQSLVLAQEQDNVGGGFNSGQDWEGLLDEMLIYRNALSNADILTLYNNQNTGKDWDGTVHACQTTPPPPPPIDYGYSDWHFDEDNWNGTANEVIDSHGGQHGTGFNVSAVPGKVCNAIDLGANSTTDYARLGAGSLDGVGDFTISVWHKGSSTSGRSLLSGAVSGSINELIFWHSSATSFGGHLKGSNLGSIPVSNIANNTWRHLVWRRTGGQSCYFIDTQLQGCQTTHQPVSLNISSLILGQEQDSLGGNFDINQDWEGLIDEMLIFRRSLPNAEINSIYNNQNNGKNWDGSIRACPNMPNMKLTKTSAVMSDPVNTTSNPKRIPGAIIRYTINAQNAHGTAAEDVIIRDDLSAEIAAGKILWFGNIKATSPNINGGVTIVLTDTVGDDQGDFFNNKLMVSCGDISNVAPCIVTYEVEITQ